MSLSEFREKYRDLSIEEKKDFFRELPVNEQIAILGLIDANKYRQLSFAETKRVMPVPMDSLHKRARMSDNRKEKIIENLFVPRSEREEGEPPTGPELKKFMDERERKHHMLWGKDEYIPPTSSTRKGGRKTRSKNRRSKRNTRSKK